MKNKTGRKPKQFCLLLCTQCKIYEEMVWKHDPIFNHMDMKKFFCFTEKET